MQPMKHGIWLDPKALMREAGWREFAAGPLKRLRKHTKARGAIGDLTLVAPHGGYRASDESLPLELRMRLRGRCRNGPSDNDPRGEVAKHPEAVGWAQDLDPRGLGDIEAWLDGVEIMRESGWDQITVYVGSFAYLTLPKRMAMWPYVRSRQPVDRIAFDQSPLLGASHHEFLERLAKDCRVAHEVFNDSSTYPPKSQVQGALDQLIRHAEPGTGRSVAKKKNTRAMCLTLEEVEEAARRGWRPLLRADRKMEGVFDRPAPG